MEDPVEQQNSGAKPDAGEPGRPSAAGASGEPSPRVETVNGMKVAANPGVESDEAADPGKAR